MWLCQGYINYLHLLRHSYLSIIIHWQECNERYPRDELITANTSTAEKDNCLCVMAMTYRYPQYFFKLHSRTKGYFSLKKQRKKFGWQTQRLGLSNGFFFNNHTLCKKVSIQLHNSMNMVLSLFKFVSLLTDPKSLHVRGSLFSCASWIDYLWYVYWQVWSEWSRVDFCKWLYHFVNSSRPE